MFNQAKTQIVNFFKKALGERDFSVVEKFSQGDDVCGFMTVKIPTSRGGERIGMIKYDVVNNEVKFDLESFTIL